MLCFLYLALCATLWHSFTFTLRAFNLHIVLRHINYFSSFQDEDQQILAPSNPTSERHRWSTRGVRVPPPRRASSGSPRNNIFQRWRHRYALPFHDRTIGRRSQKRLPVPPLPPRAGNHERRSKAGGADLRRTGLGGQGGSVRGEDRSAGLRRRDVFVRVAPGERRGRRVRPDVVFSRRGCQVSA